MALKWVGRILLLGALSAASWARAATPGLDGEPSTRSYSQHSLTKIRPGSMLKADLPAPDPVELRGDLERRRDAELTKHFTRVAQLDVIADIAERVHHISLQEKVDEVRRKEEQRFHMAMQDLRQTIWQRVVAETP